MVFVRYYFDEFKIKSFPKIVNYSDYEMAKRLYNHPYYRLGFALVQAYKNFYKGGFIKFYKEARKIFKRLQKSLIKFDDKNICILADFSLGDVKGLHPLTSLTLCISGG